MIDTETMLRRLKALRLDVDVDALEELCEEIKQRDDGARYTADLVMIMEENADFDFGVPGAIVHTLEKFRGTYERHLLDSLRRKPTGHTVWMLNRIVNASKDEEQTMCLELMLTIALDDQSSPTARENARFYLEYQLDMSWDNIEADAKNR